MEFPDLGNQCSNRNCKQLDFLPLRCNSCQKLFCKNHYLYDQHGCTEAYRRDNQVPECPLCGAPIPVRPGERPDEKVGQHIDTNCRSQPACQLKGKIFGNRCSMAKCKKKELVPMVCPQCRANFCISHRLEADHNCTGPSRGGRSAGMVSAAGAAAVWRAARSMSNTSAEGGSAGRGADKSVRDIHSAQRGITDDEALSLALSNSRLTTAAASSIQPPSRTGATGAGTSVNEQQEAADLALALALQASEQEERQQRLRQRQQAVQPSGGGGASRRSDSGCGLS